MKHQHKSDRKTRTRGLIQCGGLIFKSGLLEAFNITPGDDLQNYENRTKATQLLGFLITCFEENSFDEENLEKWRLLGNRRL